MDELAKYAKNLRYYVKQQEQISQSYQQMSAALNEKEYQTKLEYGMEYACEDLSQKIYPYLQLENDISFVTATLSERLTGLLSERIQAEMAISLSKQISSAIHAFMWWGIGAEDDCMTVIGWINLLDDIVTMPQSAPCNRVSGKKSQSITSKKKELSGLWDIIYQCRFCSSPLNNTHIAPKELDTLLSFSSKYSEIKHIHGFDSLFSTTATLSKKTRKIQRHAPAYKDVTAAAKIISGRADVLICRSSLDGKEKARTWLSSLSLHRTITNTTLDRLNPKRVKKTRYDILLYNLNEWKEKENEDFDSVLESLFCFLITEENFSEDKQPLVSAITQIYQTFFSDGEPPWYPDRREEPYYPNPDIVKCAHFLFVLGKLGIGCLAGRWEEESLQYLLKNQSQKGYWSSSTFKLRPDNYATVVAMYALALWKPDGWRDAAQRAAQWLWTKQRADGSWSFHGHRSNFHVYVDALNLSEQETEIELNLSDKPILLAKAKSRYKAPDPIETVFEEKEGRVSPFSFPDGQVYFLGIDLRFPTGRPQEIFKKVVQNYPKVSTYHFLENSDNEMYTATNQLRKDISIINRHLMNGKVPYIIMSIKNTGYIMRNRDE